MKPALATVSVAESRFFALPFFPAGFKTRFESLTSTCFLILIMNSS